MSVELTATEDDGDSRDDDDDDDDDEDEMKVEIQQQIDNMSVPDSLPDKAVCIQIHTGV